jgi:hypothetical protein
MIEELVEYFSGSPGGKFGPIQFSEGIKYIN